MRKFEKGFVSGIAATLLVASLGVTAFAAYQEQATLSYNDIKITLDGTAIVPTDANGNEVEPFIIDGTTYLPVRGIASALDLDVSWDADTKTVVLSSEDVETSTEVVTDTYSRTNPAPLNTIQTTQVESYVYGDYNLSAVILESVRGDAAWTKIEDANMFNDETPDGQEYILVKIRVSLNSIDGDGYLRITDYDFKAFSEDNVSYDSPFVVEPEPAFSGEIYAGGSLEGYAVYLVDKDDENPKLCFGADYSGSGGIWFAMN